MSHFGIVERGFIMKNTHIVHINLRKCHITFSLLHNKVYAQFSTFPVESRHPTPYRVSPLLFMAIHYFLLTLLNYLPIPFRCPGQYFTFS